MAVPSRICHRNVSLNYDVKLGKVYLYIFLISLFYLNASMFLTNRPDSMTIMISWEDVCLKNLGHIRIVLVLGKMQEP